MGSGDIHLARAAADANFDVILPVMLPVEQEGNAGAKITSIDFYYTVATAALDAMDYCLLYKAEVQASGSPIGFSDEIESTLDEDHDTGAERITVGTHKMTFTIDNPEIQENDEMIYVYLGVNAAATSVFKLFGARVHYELSL